MIAAGGFVFLAGQGPTAPDGPRIEGSFEEQARQTFSNLRAVAEEAGGSLADAVRVGVYLMRFLSEAEGEGFEPSIRLTTDNGFRDRRIRPLCHPSAAGTE